MSVRSVRCRTSSLALADANYLIPLSVVCFFALPLVFTIFFGRTFCASVCPLGAVQELLAVRTIHVPRWLDHALGMVPFLYLGAAVVLAATGTGFVICRYDPFVAFFRLGGNANMLVFGTCLLAVSVFIGRPYCRYSVPLRSRAGAAVAGLQVASADRAGRVHHLPVV